MQTHQAKRVEIIIEAPMERRLTDALIGAGGSGRSGRWTREGQVGRSGMVAVICIVRPERVDALLEAAFKVVERHIGVVSVTDCEVLRAERF